MRISTTLSAFVIIAALCNIPCWGGSTAAEDAKAVGKGFGKLGKETGKAFKGVTFDGCCGARAKWP